MSSQTLCSVWEKWETILLNPGRSKFNGIRTTIISVNFIEFLDNLWNSSGFFTGFTTLEILDEIQKMMAELKCEPEQFQGRIIFMSMYNNEIFEFFETSSKR